MLGQIISHYKIIAKLGGGGMGVVYKAEDIKLKRPVALKFLPTELSRDEEAQERFVHEAQAASALDHPNICTIYEIGETEDEQIFIAMAYYEGETLKEKIVGADGGSPLPIDLTIEIAIQMVQGLAKAHEKGIVHRDIKPANVIITKDGLVKILDFGLAKLAGGTRLTRTGTTLGTPAYMSPEQVSLLETDQRSDIWSLGVVMYEMLTGKLPFEGEHGQPIMYAIVNSEPEPLGKLRADVPEAVAQIVTKALAKEPNDRYQGITDLLDDLKSPTEKIKSKRSFLTQKLAAAKHWYFYAGLTVLTVALILTGPYWRPQSPTTIDSIAVLPLQNLSGDPEQEYFADGMTEALIVDLARIKSVRVISRTSVMQFKNTREPLPEIAKKLNVDAVVEGSISRSGARVHITAQLIDAPTDRHLWTEEFDRNVRDVLVLQREVAEAIVRGITGKLIKQEQQRMTSARPVDPEAYPLYLKGREYFNNTAFDKGVESFQQAIHLDPTFAPAYASLALCYVYTRVAEPGGGPLPREVYPRAKAAAMKALALDENLGEAHAALAMIKFYYDWEWDSPDEEFKHALSLEPQNTTILMSYSVYLRLAIGRFDDGISLLQKAITLDPLSPAYSMSIGRAYGLARRYDESTAKLRPLFELYRTILSGSTKWRGTAFSRESTKKLWLLPIEDQN